VGNIKAVGRIYQQTFIDTYCKVAFVKLYDRKNALVAADLLNDRVVPFYDAHEIPLLRMLTDRGTEYCGNREAYEYKRVLPRGADELVRSPWSGLPAGNREKHAAFASYSTADETRALPLGAKRQACTALHQPALPHPEQLVTLPTGDRQGRIPGQGRQPPDSW